MTRSTDLIEILSTIAAEDDFAAFAYDGVTYALIFHPYSPQIEGKLMVDNYYPAYQAVRAKRLSLEQATADFAPMAVEYPYKGIALLSGKVKRLYNSLTAHEEYGTYFVMEMLCYRGEWAKESEFAAQLEGVGVDLQAFLTPTHPDHLAARGLADPYVTYSGCAECGKCVLACPTGAIQPPDFCRDKCLREWQGKGEFPIEVAKAMGSRVLGCHTCQAVCPVNVGKIPTAPIVDGDALWQGVIEGKKGLLPFGDLLGHNYLRPVKLGVLCLNALANARDPQAKEVAAQWLTHPDERLRLAARRYLERVGVKPQLEREVKGLIDQQTYLAYCDKGVTTLQTNYYLQAGDHRLRIRHKGEDWELTLKVRVGEDRELGHYEYNAPLSSEVAQRFLTEGLPRADTLRYLGIDVGGDATLLGSLSTYRTVWIQDGLRWELDKSEYLGVTDYEIECEVDSEEEWLRAKEWVKTHMGVEEQSIGKYKRFCRRLEQLKQEK